MSDPQDNASAAAVMPAVQVQAEVVEGPHAAAGRAAARKKSGPPKKLLTADQINQLERLAEAGATQHEMAALVGIDEDTLRRRTRDQPEVGQALLRAGALLRTSLRRKQIAIALSDKHPAQATMLVWLGKTLLGQTERINLKIETANDALARLREVWPDLDADEIMRELAVAQIGPGEGEDDVEDEAGGDDGDDDGPPGDDAAGAAGDDEGGQSD